MRDEQAKRERIVITTHWGSGLRQWTLVLAPIVAVYLQQQLAYALVTWACRRSEVLVHLPTLLAIAIIAVSTLLAWRDYQHAGARAPGDERSSDARERFMSACALTLSAFSTVVLVAVWLPTVFIHPCQR